jgi:hypothetical protein
MTTPRESRELTMDELHDLSGGATETGEIVVKAVVKQDRRPQAPTRLPMPTIRIRF